MDLTNSYTVFSGGARRLGAGRHPAPAIAGVPLVPSQPPRHVGARFTIFMVLEGGSQGLADACHENGVSTAEPSVCRRVFI